MADDRTLTIKIDGDSSGLLKELQKAEEALGRTFRVFKDQKDVASQLKIWEGLANSESKGRLERERLIKNQIAAQNAELERQGLAKIKAAEEARKVAEKEAEAQKKAEEAKRKAIIDAAAKRTAERKKKEAKEAAEAAKQEAIELEKIRKELVAIERAKIEGNFRKYFSDVSKKNKGFSAYVQAEEDLKIQRAIARHNRKLAKRTQSADKESISGDNLVIPDRPSGAESLANGLSKVTNALGTFVNIGKVVGKTVVPRIITGFKMAAVYTAKFGVSIARIALGGIQKRLKSVSDSLKHLTNRFSRFISQLGRIVVYRAFRAFLGELSKGFSEGVKNLYAWSSSYEKTDKTFKSSMDSMSTSLQYLRNSVAAAVEPLANALAPILEELTNKFVNLINVVNQFFAAMFGQSTWTKAIRKQKAFEDATSSAGKALEKQLLGFDEINRLNDNSGSGSSSATDAEGMFETVTELLSLEKYDFVNAIRQNIEGGDWKGVGATLGECLNKVFKRLEASEIGSIIGEKIQSGIDFANSFFETTSWETLGTTIALKLNDLIESISPESLGAFFTNKINSIIEIGRGFVENFAAGDTGVWLATAINSWFDNIKWDDLEATISGAINGIFDFAKNFLNTLDWEGIGRKTYTLINGLIEHIEWRDISSTICRWIRGLFNWAITTIEGLDWANIGTKLYDFLSGIDWKGIFIDLGRLIIDALGGMLTLIASFTSSAIEHTNYFKEKNTRDTESWNASVTGESNVKKTLNYAGAKASGGYIDSGSMFIAGEAGAEFVGTINGRTGVMNTSQFGEVMQPTTEAIYAIGSAIVGAVNGIEMPSVKIGDREIYRASERGKRLTGTSLVMGVR